MSSVYSFRSIVYIGFLFASLPVQSMARWYSRMTSNVPRVAPLRSTTINFARPMIFAGASSIVSGNLPPWSRSIFNLYQPLIKTVERRYYDRTFLGFLNTISGVRVKEREKITKDFFDGSPKKLRLFLDFTKDSAESGRLSFSAITALKTLMHMYPAEKNKIQLLLAIDVVKKLCPLCHTEGDLTWTEAHLLHIAKEDPEILYDSLSFSSFYRHPDTKKTFNRFIELERSYKNKGYTTFVHGQSWDLQLLTKLYTDLWSIKNKQKVSDFIFPRIPVGSSALENMRYNFIINTGKSCIIDAAKFALFGYEEGVVFANNSLASNHRCPPISTLYLYANSQGANWPSVANKMNKMLEKAFDIVGYSKIFDTYKQEIDELRMLHKKAEHLGNIMLFAIPNKDLSKWVYHGQVGARKQKARINSLPTEDVLAITEATWRTPQNVIGHATKEKDPEYIVILETLRPDSGVKVHNINLPEIQQTPEYKKFEQKYNELIEKIKKDIQRLEVN